MTAVNLNNAVGYLQIHLLADKAVRHGILVCQVGYMEIRTNDAPVFPYGIFIRKRRKRTQRNALICFKNLPTASFALLEGFVIEIIQRGSNVRFQIADGGVHIIAQTRDDGGGDLSDCALYRRLVLWLFYAGGHDGCAVVV